MQADDDEDESTYDEHVWLSLKNAQTVCNVITDKLSSIDTQNATTYQNNTKAYIEQLNNLDNQYQDAVDNANQKTLLFGDRFPFRYLVDDYGLSYYAAFAGCSAETEASFETISFLASKVDELELNTVITIEGTDHSIAQTIVDNTKTKNQQILSLNSMQSTTSKDVENGTTYLSIMENNLSVLKEALA
jgi:zinc transport system substrate-binding protein